MCVPAFWNYRSLSHTYMLFYGRSSRVGFLFLLIWVAERSYKLFAIRELGSFSSPVAVPHAFLAFYCCT